jgi:hypothetical protein
MTIMAGVLIMELIARGHPQRGSTGDVRHGGVPPDAREVRASGESPLPGRLHLTYSH